jgi:hypothetical protein
MILARHGTRKGFDERNNSRIERFSIAAIGFDR